MKTIHITATGSITELTIDGTNQLHSLQAAVGGYVEFVTLTHNLVLILNEEGKIAATPEPHNAIANQLIKHFGVALMPGDHIVGNVVLAGQSGSELEDVPQLAVDELAKLGHTVSSAA